MRDAVSQPSLDIEESYFSKNTLFFFKNNFLLTSERSEEVPFLRGVRREGSAGGPLRSCACAYENGSSFWSRVTKIGVKVYWTKLAVLALSELGYRTRSVRNRARSAPKCLFLRFLASPCIFKG